MKLRHVLLSAASPNNFKPSSLSPFHTARLFQLLTVTNIYSTIQNYDLAGYPLNPIHSNIVNILLGSIDKYNK